MNEQDDWTTLYDDWLRQQRAWSWRRKMAWQLHRLNVVFQTYQLRLGFVLLHMWRRLRGKDEWGD